MLIAGAFAASLGACSQTEDSAEVQDDTAAQSEAMTQAPADDMNQGATPGQAESPLALAESEHQAAMERCDALPSTEQQACKDEADATLEAAKAAASLPGPS